MHAMRVKSVGRSGSIEYKDWHQPWLSRLYFRSFRGCHWFLGSSEIRLEGVLGCNSGQEVRDLLKCVPPFQGSRNLGAFDLKI